MRGTTVSTLVGGNSEVKSKCSLPQVTFNVAPAASNSRTTWYPGLLVVLPNAANFRTWLIPEVDLVSSLVPAATYSPTDLPKPFDVKEATRMPLGSVVTFALREVCFGPVAAGTPTLYSPIVGRGYSIHLGGT